MITVNGRTEEHLDESVADLVRRLELEPRGIAVAIDGEIVRRSDWGVTKIVDESVIEIVTAVAGG